MGLVFANDFGDYSGDGTEGYAWHKEWYDLTMPTGYSGTDDICSKTTGGHVYYQD